MCRRVAEGVQYRGCGHFKRTLVAAIVDCGSKTCTKSVKHPVPEAPCSSCARRRCIDCWGPDVPKVIGVSEDVCSGCKFQPGTHPPSGSRHYR